jgi:hypothetical protein
MEYELSTPLRELPKFLSTISMVTDDIAAIVQKLKFAERKSPSRYDPAREHFVGYSKATSALIRESIRPRGFLIPCSEPAPSTFC